MKKEIIGDCTLYLADCRDVMAEMEDKSVDAVVTDPPYGVGFIGKKTKRSMPQGGYISSDSDVGAELAEVYLAKSERAVVFPGTHIAFDYPKPSDLGGVYCPSGAGRGRWGFHCMALILFYGKSLLHGTQSPNSFTSYARSGDNGHPCPKPIEWMRWAVAKCSMDGDLIFDPFMGSGTTGVACVELGRKFIGVEIEERYFDIACKRIDMAERQGKLF